MGATSHFHWHYAELDDQNFQVHGRSLIFIIVLFCLLLLFILFCLYARWVFRYRYRRFTTTSSSSPMATTITPLDPDRAVRPPTLRTTLGLDPDTISSFPIILHRSTTYVSDDNHHDIEMQCCSICLSTLEEDEKVKVLPVCNHTYHPECVDKWLTTQSSCPLCRASLLRVDSPTDSTLP